MQGDIHLYMADGCQVCALSSRGCPCGSACAPSTQRRDDPSKLELSSFSLSAALPVLCASCCLLVILLLSFTTLGPGVLSSLSFARTVSLLRPVSLPSSSIQISAGPFRQPSRPTAITPLRFLALGDWGRNGTYNQSLVAEQMAAVALRVQPQFVLSTGDNFYEEGLRDERAAEFEESFSAVYNQSSLNVPWLAVLGNHDYYGNVLAQLSDGLVQRDRRWQCSRSRHLSFPLCPGLGTRGAPPTSCRYSLDLFLYDTTPLVRMYRYKEKYRTKHHMDWRGLNTEDWTAQEQEQLQELEGWLNSSLATWKVVVGHHPVFSYGHHGSQPELLASVKPLLEKYGVHVYMNGHDHDIQHIKFSGSSVHYLTNGGGSKAWSNFTPTRDAPGLEYFWPGQGFGVFEASPKSLGISFYGALGDLLHSFSLAYKEGMNSV